jgi:hypothetical protein
MHTTHAPTHLRCILHCRWRTLQRLQQPRHEPLVQHPAVQAAQVLRQVRPTGAVGGQQLLESC